VLKLAGTGRTHQAAGRSGDVFSASAGPAPIGTAPGTRVALGMAAGFAALAIAQSSLPVGRSYEAA